MGDISYRPLIEDMTWSYSRLDSFSMCKRGWFMKYISGIKEDKRFYSSYGTFIHELLEMYYNGILSKDEMYIRYLTKFSTEVVGERPAPSTVEKYISGGAEYLKAFSPLPYNMIDVEKRLEFTIGESKFVGVIDYLGEKDGELYIVDNKSRGLKPRSTRSKPALKDKELDSMLKQLYIYSAAVEQEFGKLPSWLCFNCYRTGAFIKEPFKQEAYEEAKKWALDTIEMICDEEEFEANINPFACKWICGLTYKCQDWIDNLEEWKEMNT